MSAEKKIPRIQMVNDPGIQFFKARKLLLAKNPRADLRLWATSVSARRLALERLDVSGVVFGDVESPLVSWEKLSTEPQQKGRF